MRSARTVGVTIGIATIAIVAASCSSDYGSAADGSGDAGSDATLTGIDGSNASDAAGPGCPGCTSLATGQNVPTEIVLAIGFVHWLNTGSNASVPMRIREDGSGLETGITFPAGLHDLVWSNIWPWAADNTGHVRRLLPDSSCDGPTDVRRLTAFGGSETWVWSTNDGLRRQACGGPGPVTLLSGFPGVLAVTSDAPRVWWYRIDDGTIASCDASGTSCMNTVTVLATKQPETRVLAVDDARVYWATATPPASIRTRAKSLVGMGGDPIVIASDQGDPKTLVPRGSDLYWTDADRGTVMKAPAAGGGTPTIFASGLDRPWGLASGSAELYVAESGGGRITRIPIR